jgi:hypothetical protein
MPGLLLDGRLVDVPGKRVLSPGEEPWVKLVPNDHGPRPSKWPRQITLHTTQGKWPQIIVPSAPRSGTRAEQIARYWSSNGTPGGAPLIVDGDMIACLVDLVLRQGYHATKCNPYSIGIEMVQEPDGTIGSDTIDTAVDLALVLCNELGIPAFVDNQPYRSNRIIERLKYGGPDVVGIHGHRSNAWMFPEWLTEERRKVYPLGYADRGRGDPGDEVFVRFIAKGAIAFDFDNKGELDFVKCAQRMLNARYSERLVEDGVCGPGTVAALRRHNLWNRGLLGGLLVEAP